MLIGEGHKDGFIIDTQGYDYARYTAHIPNAEQLAIVFRYPSLENAVHETALAADTAVQKAIESGDKEYGINIDEVRNKFRGAGFSEGLLYAALKDRPEIESADFDGEYILCTVRDEYVRQTDPRRALTQEEADIMLAKHILWLNDAGGIQADFSNCLVRGLNLAHKNMMNVAIDNARFADTDLQGAELNFSVINNTRFESCTVTDRYWFRPEGSAAVYEDIRFKENYFSELALRGDPDSFSNRPSRTPELTNTGSFEKCWKLINGEWWMYKSGNEKEYFSELFICRLGEKLGLPMAHYELDGEYIRSKDFTNGAEVNFEPMRSLADDDEDYENCFNILNEISPDIAVQYLLLLWMDTVC